VPGAPGAPGAPGDDGAPGAPGVGDSALFYAVMPPDNSEGVATGADVQFPQDGPTTSPGTMRVNESVFALAEIGVYRITFRVPVIESGQLQIMLDGVAVPYAIAGRATGTNDISLTTLVRTTTTETLLSVRNPSGNPSGLTITNFAGGSQASSATLLIELVKAG